MRTITLRMLGRLAQDRGLYLSVRYFSQAVAPLSIHALALAERMVADAYVALPLLLSAHVHDLLPVK